MLRLNADQSEIVNFVQEGHNVLITGQAGVGKSEVVKFIIRGLKAAGKKVGVVCSSGIATQVYEKGQASTVHSFYGLQTAELSWKKLIERSLDNNIVKLRMESVDSIIWDEASMSSQRMLELVNAMHHRTSGEHTKNNPFDGKQMILVGEFLQLRPVPNYFDEGNFMFLSPLFCAAVTHRFELTQIMRQSPEDQMFLKSLKEVRLGQCSENTQDYLRALSRPLDPEKDRNATHIFFKKIPALLHNRTTLATLPGEMCIFEAICDGDGCMNWPGQNVLQLKAGCRVMLIWNKSESLKNGTMGVFKSVEKEMLAVDFENVGVVLVGRETWVRRNRQGERVGSITQYPLVLAYGVTCHKSQGLTMASEVVHCSGEFVPGLIYVALSRVKKPEDLQVLNFDRKQLLKPPKNVMEICSTGNTCEPVADLSCCRMKTLKDKLFEVSDRFSEERDEEEYFSFPVEMYDGPTQASFEGEGFIPLEMNDLFIRIQRCESALCTPPTPQEPPITEVVKSLKVRATSSFATDENKTIDSLLQPDDASKDKLEAFWKLVWFHVFLIYEKHVSDNAGDTEDLVVDISRQSFTEATSSLNGFWCSQDFTNYVAALFETTEYSRAQKTVAVKIGMQIHLQFLKHLSTLIREDQENEDIAFSVEEMSAVGRSKIRYVGGWAIRKVLEHLRSFVKRNIYSTKSNTLDKVHSQHHMCELLEENIIVPYAKLEETTGFAETLEITEERQFRERGLIHISDNAYQFFMSLEGFRVKLLSNHKLREEREYLVEVAKITFKNDQELKAKWLACFQEDARAANEDCIDTMFFSVVERYVNMGASQYLRDYRRSYNLKKSTELRKRVLQRQQKNQEKSDSVPFKEIQQDRSPGKHVSHGRLLQFIQKHSDLNSLCRVYTKQQLEALCEAYNIKVIKKWNKKILAQHLSAAAKSTTTMPLTVPVDDRQFSVSNIETSEQEGSVRITLRRQ